ncbi:phage tail protein [Streptomyces sp. NPDC037389]|uniref:phage tail protein n=1 Tax=Streptomyces sp. NPDC037389 TaxID=3155369 RepID=UPI0033D83CD2
MAVGDPIRTDVFAVELGKFRVATYQAVEGLPFGQDAPDAQSVTPSGKLLTGRLPGNRQLPDLTLSRPTDASKQWIDWVTQTAAQQGADPERANISISALDGAKKPVLRFTLLNAWASSWEGPAMQAGNTDPSIEKITIVYEDMTVDK